MKKEHDPCKDGYCYTVEEYVHCVTHNVHRFRESVRRAYATASGYTMDTRMHPILSAKYILRRIQG